MARLKNDVVADAFRDALGRDVEVINLAQGGYIVDQGCVVLALYGLKLEPDLILTLDGANDIVTVTKTQRPGIPYTNGTIAFGVNQPILNGFFGILKHSQIVNSLNKLFERKVEKQSQQDPDSFERTIGHVAEGLHTESVMTRGLGVPHIMVIQPYIHLRKNPPASERGLASSYQYRAKFFSHAFRRLTENLKQKEFPGEVYFVDATSAFDASFAKCFIDEVHLTHDGLRMLAEFIVSSAGKSGFAVGQNQQKDLSTDSA